MRDSTLQNGSAQFYLELKKSPRIFLAFFKKIVDIIEQNIIFGSFNRSSLHFHPHWRYLLGKEHRRRLLWVISFNCVSIVFLKSQRFLAMSTFFLYPMFHLLWYFIQNPHNSSPKKDFQKFTHNISTNKYHYIKIASKIWPISCYW